METKTTCYLCGCDIPDLEGMEYYTVNGKDICCECYKTVERNKNIREICQMLQDDRTEQKDKGDVKGGKK